MRDTRPIWRRPSYLIGAAAAGLLLVFGMLADEVIEGDTLNFDKAVLMSLRDSVDPANPIGPVWFQEAARDVTALGSFTVLGIIVCVVIGYLALAKRRVTAIYVAFAVLAGTAISTILKMVFDRPRPDLAAVSRVFTASFPSGHATISAVVYLTLGALLAAASDHIRFRVFYIGIGIVLTLLIGLSRIYLGVHYPTDVIAGWSIGTAWSLLCGLGLRYWRSRYPTAPVD